MRRKVAILSGTSVVRSGVFADWPGREVETAYGVVAVREAAPGGMVLLNRHGPQYRPPHAIDHRANVRALADMGCTHVVGVSSVGSLREDLPPGSLGACADYVSFRPATFSDEEMRALGPELANDLLPEIAPEVPGLRTGLVYVQTPGPRFETRAEIRILRGWGDVVGMTMASEADLAQEAGLRYTSLCAVDNYAHGVAGAAISAEAFRDLVRANQERVDGLFRVLRRLFG